MHLSACCHPGTARPAWTWGCLLGLSLLLGPPAGAQDLYYDIPGDPLPGGRDEEVCWSEEEDLHGQVISSNIVAWLGLESEIANDFVIDHDATIVQARWVGGYYCYTPGDPLGITSFNLRFYEDVGCVPGEVVAEIVIPNNANEVYVDEEGCVLLYSYWYDVNVPVLGGVSYWFGAQGGDHPMPPYWQWGRLSSLAVVGCESMFRSAYFAYPEWTRISDMVEFGGQEYDFSQEFVCDLPIAVEPRNWGAIKALYE